MKKERKKKKKKREERGWGGGGGGEGVLEISDLAVNETTPLSVLKTISNSSS